MASQFPPVVVEVDTPMQSEFPQPPERPPPFQMEQLLQVLSNAMLQISHTNQAMLSFLSATNDRSPDRPDSKVRPKSFSGLPSEDVLPWLDHFKLISSYHKWSDERKALEVRTLLENVAATWYVQQANEVTENWVILRDLLVQNFAHQNSAQTALQQLETLQQQAHEPVGQFGVRLNQLLVRADPTMPEHVKLFFLWPRLRPDITRRGRDQGPKTFNDAILIAQCIEACTLSDSQPRWPPPPSTDLRAQYQGATPMDIDVQNVQMQTRRNLPNRDAQGRPKCFYYHNYGHVRRYCRKLQQQSHKQQAQITMADATSLAELPGN